MEQINSQQPKTNSFLITLLSILLIVSCLIAGFFAYQTQNLVKKLAALQKVSSPTIIPVVTEKPIVAPSITSPLKDYSISSPITITGFVPQGWMFEGVFPIKILDENKKLIKQASAKELVAGSWTSENPIEFTSTITFSTVATKGYIVLENDNPSGLKENSKTFEIGVNFSKNMTACTMEAKVCPDGSAVGRTGTKCEFAPCPTTSPQP